MAFSEMEAGSPDKTLKVQLIECSNRELMSPLCLSEYDGAGDASKAHFEGYR